MNKPVVDPFRILFPLGLLFGVLGVLPWIGYDFGWLSFYPNLAHSRMMVLGFLMSFVIGFLMTAAPRMSGAKFATVFETALAVLLLSLQAFFALNNLLGPAAIFGSLQFLFLSVFLVSRILQRTQNPPPSFVFIPVALVLGFLGSLAIQFQEQLSPTLFNFGKILLYQAFILNLIVGLGGRLIPVLSRIPGSLDPTQKATNSTRTNMEIAGILLTLNLSFFAEAFIHSSVGWTLRFLVLGYTLISQFKFFHQPSEKTWLRACLRVAGLCMTFPYLLIVIWPHLELSLLHVVFISGFSLITLMVAVRVTLAHGGHNLTFEKNSKALPALAGLLLLAMVVRSLAPLMTPQFLLHFFLIAGMIWILALSFWAFIFGPKILNRSHLKD